MSHFSTFSASRFTVKVNGGSDLDSSSDDSIRLQEVGFRIRGITEEVEHGSGLRDEVEGRKGEGENGVEVSGVLGEVASFDCVVTRVVRSGCNLVQQQRAFME